MALNVTRDLVKKCGVGVEKITVLSLYEAQRKLIEQKLGSKVVTASVCFNDPYVHVNNKILLFLKGIAVRNVNAYQGKENDVIILSMGRGGDGIMADFHLSLTDLTLPFLDPENF